MKSRISIIANIAIAAMVFYGLALMFSLTAERLGEDGDRMLLAAGLHSLRYFTVLSNILAGIAAVLYLIFARRGSVPLWLASLKLAAAASVALTFTVVMGFLGPMFGYRYMFNGGNLWFHLIVPLIAMFEFVFLDSREGFPALSLRSTFLAAVPMLIYGVWYLAGVIRGGMENGYYVNDWYGFAQWGIPASLLVFVIIAAVTWLLALLLRWGNLRLR